MSDEDFLTRYKALVITSFNSKVSFDSLVEGIWNYIRERLLKIKLLISNH